MVVVQVDPEVPVSVRKSLEERDPNFRRNEADRTSGSLSTEGSENSNKSDSRILKRRRELQNNRLARPPSRPASASGQVPSIIMLTSVDHSDATRFGFRSFLSFTCLEETMINS